MNLLKKLLVCICGLFMVFALAAPASADDAVTYDSLNVNENQIVVVYTNDIHGAYSGNELFTPNPKSLGLAGVAAIKERAAKDGAAAVLVDNGDSLDGSIINSQSDGYDGLDLMLYTGYDYQVLGNHEFFLEMDPVYDYIDLGNYIGANFLDLEADEDVCDPYQIQEFEVNGETVKIAFIGILTPENLTKGIPAYFMDEDEENFIYSFLGKADGDAESLYANIQETIDEAKAEGADYVIACSHLGDTSVSAGWSSKEVVANTSGIDVILDGHAHSVIPQEKITDKNGKEVLLTSTGTQLNNIGVLQLDVEGGKVTGAKSALVNTLTDADKATSAYKDVDAYVTEKEESYEYFLEVVGETPFDLCIYDPDTEDRLVRSQETNLGDFSTDAFRKVLGGDCAILSGGFIRSDISEGEITFLDIVNVHPWGDCVVMIRATGYQILECLEHGARMAPEECAGFAQVSNITYDVNTDIPSPVVLNDLGQYDHLEGENRVQNVYIGKLPLELDKEYNLVLDESYWCWQDDGMTMFDDCEAVIDLDEYYDQDVVAEYIADYLEGEVPEDYEDVNGQGRIFVGNTAEIEAYHAELDAEESGVNIGLYFVIGLVVLSAASIIYVRKENK